jgi:hypothetical protein
VGFGDACADEHEHEREKRYSSIHF